MTSPFKRFRSALLCRATAFATPLFVMLLGVSGTARPEAPPPLGCNVNGCTGVFGSIYVDPGGHVRLTVPDGVNTSPLSCTLFGGQYLSLKRTHVSFKEIYAMLLMAQATQRTLYVRTIENTSDCEIWYVVSYP